MRSLCSLSTTDLPDAPSSSAGPPSRCPTPPPEPASGAPVAGGVEGVAAFLSSPEIAQMLERDLAAAEREVGAAAAAGGGGGGGPVASSALLPVVLRRLASLYG